MWRTFPTRISRKGFKIIKQALDQEAETPEIYVQKHLTNTLGESFTADETDVIYPDWRLQPKAAKLEALLKRFFQLRRVRIDEGLDQLLFLQNQEGDQPMTQSFELQQIALEYIQARARLDKALQQSFTPKPNQK